MRHVLALFDLRLMQLPDSLYVHQLSTQLVSHVYSSQTSLPYLMTTKIFLKMMHLDDDPIPASRIPRVRELCRALGFEGSSIQSQKIFIRWRKNYRTASGVSGMDITDWASATERYNLGVMAQHYLQTGGHAQQYWPSHGRASPRAGPEYPKDEIM